MPFERGSVSFRMFYSPRKLPGDAVERFAKLAAPPIDTSSDSGIRGWVTGRHLLDRQIDEDTAFYGGYLRLAHMEAERKIPASLLRAECRMEELAHANIAEDGKLSRKVQRDIKQSVIERLTPKMPPQLKGMPFVFDDETRVLYGSVLSIKQLDAFLAYFSQTMGFQITPCLPDVVAQHRKKVDPGEWSPTSFSPDCSDHDMVSMAGQEFLTWLWFFGEARGGTVYLEEHGEVGVLIEGPLTFVREGDGAHEIVLKKGEPILSAEAKTCLLSGKKLKMAKLTVAAADQAWQTTLDADEFVFRGLKLPDVEAYEPVTRFQERMRLLNQFSDIFFQLYDRFLDERSKPATWKKTVAEIHEWVSSRHARM